MKNSFKNQMEVLRRREVLLRAYHTEQKQRIMRMPQHVLAAHDTLFSFAWDYIGNGYVLYDPPQFRLIEPFRAEIRIIAMAKDKSTGKAGSIGEWNGIANVSFGKQDVSAMQDWSAEVDTQAVFADLIASDYKASFSWDSRSDIFMCSLSCYNSSDPNFKFTMVSRAPSPAEALLVALYKHSELCSGVWSGKSKDDGWG